VWSGKVGGKRFGEKQHREKKKMNGRGENRSSGFKGKEDVPMLGRGDFHDGGRGLTQLKGEGSREQLGEGSQNSAIGD